MPQPCQRSSRPSLPKPPAGVVTVASAAHQPWIVRTRMRVCDGSEMLSKSTSRRRPNSRPLLGALLLQGVVAAPRTRRYVELTRHRPLHPTDHSTDRIEQELVVERFAEVRGRSGLFEALAR
jgi:hypothetical protein